MQCKGRTVKCPVYPKEVDLVCNWSLETFLLKLASKRALDRQNRKTFGFGEKGWWGEGLQWYTGTVGIRVNLPILCVFELKQRRKKKPGVVFHPNERVKHSGSVFRFFLGTMATPGCKNPVWASASRQDRGRPGQPDNEKSRYSGFGLPGPHRFRNAMGRPNPWWFGGCRDPWLHGPA
jgi:hypothetical protein